MISLFASFPKKVVCFSVALMCLCGVVRAQNANQYSFVAVQGTFTSILGQSGVGTIPTIHGADQISNGIVPCQFTFDSCGNSYTGLRVSSNGWVSFNSGVGSSLPVHSLANLNAARPALMPLWDNLTGASAVGATGLFMT